MIKQQYWKEVYKALDPFTSDVFREAAWIVLDVETYDNNLHKITVDLGGATKYGISKRAFPHLNIENLTLEETFQIYHNYFQAAKAQYMERNLAIMHFNMGFNAGTGTAAKLLQEAINDTIPGKDMTLIVDGKIGPKTLKALKYSTDTLNANTILFQHYVINMIKRYKTIANVRRGKSYSKWAVELLSWLNRTYIVMDYIKIGNAIR